MNLYLISQDTEIDYDTFDSAVVCARSAKDARTLYPGARGGGVLPPHPANVRIPQEPAPRDWVNDPNAVTVQYLGKAKRTTKTPRVVLASFNAG
jgi:hypothetical protein